MAKNKILRKGSSFLWLGLIEIRVEVGYGKLSHNGKLTVFSAQLNIYSNYNQQSTEEGLEQILSNKLINSTQSIDLNKNLKSNIDLGQLLGKGKTIHTFFEFEQGVYDFNKFMVDTVRGLSEPVKRYKTTFRNSQRAIQGDPSDFTHFLEMMTAQSDIAYHNQRNITLQKDWDEVISMILDFIPIIGTIKAIIELISGKDPATQDDVDRTSAGIGVLLTALPVIGPSLKKPLKRLSKSAVARKALKFAIPVKAAATLVLESMRQGSHRTFLKIMEKVFRRKGADHLLSKFHRANSLKELEAIDELKWIFEKWKESVDHVITGQVNRFNKKFEGSHTIDNDLFISKLRRKNFEDYNPIFDGDKIYDSIRDKFWNLIISNESLKKKMTDLGFRFYKGPAPYYGREMLKEAFQRVRFNMNKYKVTIDHKFPRYRGAQGAEFISPEHLTFIPQSMNSKVFHHELEYLVQ